MLSFANGSFALEEAWESEREEGRCGKLSELPGPPSVLVEASVEREKAFPFIISLAEDR